MNDNQKNTSNPVTDRLPENAPGGVICINKPAGCSSHDVVGRARRLFGTRQVGHTGTLDPMATGVLVVMVGRAVKASELLTSEDKRYIAGIRLGVTTDTEDTEGQVLTEFHGELPRLSHVEDAVAHFTGEIMQTPPMYSALKVGGKKLVDLARKGVEVERQARPVTVSAIAVSPTEDPAVFTLDVSCSKGTYIRTLCANIGAYLGCGAAMCSLHRVASGAFSIDDAKTIEELAEMDFSARIAALRPVERLFEGSPEVTLAPFFAHLAACGCEVYQKKLRTALPDGALVRLCDDSGFFALGRVTEYPDGSAIKPIKQFRI